MRKADNFDAKQWLVENKITFQSRLNENEEFSDDFPSLDYNTITNFIKSKGYKITSYYYDGGFDVNDGEYFIGVFDDHIAVTDGNGQVKVSARNLGLDDLPDAEDFALAPKWIAGPVLVPVTEGNQFAAGISEKLWGYINIFCRRNNHNVYSHSPRILTQVINAKQFVYNSKHK